MSWYVHFAGHQPYGLINLQMLQASNHGMVGQALREISYSAVKKNAIIRRMP